MTGSRGNLLGAALREARERGRITQRDAVKGCGISYSTLSRIENGLVTVPSLEVAMAVARNVGLGEGDVLRLAGTLAPAGSAELADPSIRRVLQDGRLSPDALSTLRLTHLRLLASEFSADLGSARPVDVRLAAKKAGLTLVPYNSTEARFARQGRCYEFPRGSDGALMGQRLWGAHGIAHRLIAAESGAVPECHMREVGSVAEREATYVASRILVPHSLLASDLRQRPLPQDPAEFATALERVASRFRVPTQWASARVAEDKIGELYW
ncbi:helix-turn-helix domain-containing protein [Actinacidiphila glaucinigra]|uniref:helix-turn-helix domain-containing protein n=1 Tax=Actinacidiphila glaucinigra TaxID=235986 RepID=UPI0038699410